MSFIDFDEDNLPVKMGLVDFGVDRPEARHSLTYILSDLADIKKSYFLLGFHLNEFKQLGYYKDFGYESMEEFAAANLGLDKSALSRCISVFYRFNAANDREFLNGVEKRGRAMDLSVKYKDYSYSQLCEMVSLDNEELSQVSPDMTVKEIREFKKTLKSKKSVVDDPDDLLKAVRETSKKNENVSQVATSQLEDAGEVLAPDQAPEGTVQSRSLLSFDDLAKLHGAALAAKIRFASSLGEKNIFVYDPSGHVLLTEEAFPLRGLPCALLYSDDDNVVLRIESLDY